MLFLPMITPCLGQLALKQPITTWKVFTSVMTRVRGQCLTKVVTLVERLGLTRRTIRQLGACLLSVVLRPLSYLLIKLVLIELVIVTPLFKTMQSPHVTLPLDILHRFLNRLTLRLLMLMQWTLPATLTR